jgi:hypothetical protein
MLESNPYNRYLEDLKNAVKSLNPVEQELKRIKSNMNNLGEDAIYEKELESAVEMIESNDY